MNNSFQVKGPFKPEHPGIFQSRRWRPFLSVAQTEMFSWMLDLWMIDVYVQ